MKIMICPKRLPKKGTLLPLPSGERSEVRGGFRDASYPLTLTLSPQGRGD